MRRWAVAILAVVAMACGGAPFPPLCAAAPTVALSENTYREIRSVSQRVLELCPPATCLLIGLGRSPTPIIADLQLREEGYAFNLPLSAFRNHPQGDKISLPPALEQLEPMIQPLSPQAQADFFRHLARFTPGKTVRRNRRIMVLDYSQSGLSLFAFQSYLRRYLASAGGVPPEVGVIALSPKNRLERVSEVSAVFDVKGLEIIVRDSASSLMTYLRNQVFDDLSEFPSHEVGSTAPLFRRDLYAALKDELRRHASREEGCIERVARELDGSRD